MVEAATRAESISQKYGSVGTDTTGGAGTAAACSWIDSERLPDAEITRAEQSARKLWKAGMIRLTPKARAAATGTAGSSLTQDCAGDKKM